MTTSFGAVGSRAYGVALQADGRLVLVGESDNNFALARYNADGSPDDGSAGDTTPADSFGTAGRLTIDFHGGWDAAYGVAVQADGKIVAAGLATLADGTTAFGVARLNPDGALDAGFDADGRVTTAFGEGWDQAFAVAIQGDGKIVAAGLVTVGGENVFGAARYNLDGTPDSSFDTDGRASIRVNGYEYAQALAVQPDGMLVLGGWTWSGTDYDFGIARLTAAGAPDITFSGDGVLSTDFSANRADYGFGLALQDDEKIVAAGYSDAGGGYEEFALARYLSDGTLDPTFDGDGKVLTGFGTSAHAMAVAVQPDGKILAVGYSGGLAALARYNPDGSPDPSFGVGGKFTPDLGGGSTAALYALALRPDGRFVAGGYTDGLFLAAQFQPDDYVWMTPDAPENLTAMAVSATQVNLSWADNSDIEDGFLIEVSFDGIDFVGLATVPRHYTGYSWTDAYPNAVLYFRVVATNGPVRSAPSNVASVQTAPLPPEHVATAVLAADRIDLAWGGITTPDNSPVTGQALERRATGGAWGAPVALAASATTHSDTGLTEATLYEYRLRRSNAAGTSDYSEIVSAYTLPAAPTSLTARLVQNTQIDLSWSDNSNGETGYLIEGSVAGGAWRTLATIGAGLAAHSLTDLAGGVRYDFRVRAQNQSGESDASNTAGADTVCGWTTYGESTVSGQTITMGESGRDEGATQPAGVHGASIRLAPADGYTLTIDRNLSTWDSYTADTGGNTGYWDSFSVSLTDRPYPELSLTDPLNLPFVWGGTRWGDEVLETDTGTRQVTLTGDPNQAMYLNVVLDTQTGTHTDGAFPSWGTITISSPDPLPAYCPPLVSVQATGPQAAEGGSAEARGQFTVYRDSADNSEPLTVTYTVDTSSGQATLDSDYTALSGTVTILAGAESATIDVSGLPDTDASEDTEPVTIALAASPAYATRPATSRAVVNVLNRKEYLISFYGKGGPATYADEWLDALAIDVDGRTNYILRQYRHYEWAIALQQFLAAINADGNDEITRAEAASSDLRVMGYSYGGTQAINFTRDLNREVWFGGTQASRQGFTLKASVPVKKLVTIDPVETVRILGRSIPGPWKHRTGSVETNVSQFANYYEQSRRTAVFEQLVGGARTGVVSKLGNELHNLGAVLLIGGRMPSNLPAQQEFQGRVDQVFAQEFRIRDRINATDIPVAGTEWRLKGFHANHLSVMWWSYDHAKNDLLP